MNEAVRMIVLVAPNVSEQMGGEAIKALQIFREFKKLNPNTIQITHERCKAELSGRLKLCDVHFVPDTWLAKLLWRSILFRQLVDVWFSVRAVKLAEAITSGAGKANRSTVIHQTEPNSPVMIRALSKLCLNVFGPINGNIYYPEIFRKNESLKVSIRRKLHLPIQRLSAIFLKRFKKADVIFAAGGERTISSLLAAGYDRKTIKETVDCGVPDEILDQQRITHQATNFQFVHYGRLVYHKGTFLAIESLRQADNRVTLDIVGTGPELEACRRLVETLQLENRVTFLGWIKSHRELLALLRKYRGMVLPSLEDANGIVVQESLALGLPPICLDWGGPQLLIEHGRTGFLVDPSSQASITKGIAEAFDQLGTLPELAERMSIAGRARAEAWRWSRVAKEWMASYAQSV